MAIETFIISESFGTSIKNIDSHSRPFGYSRLRTKNNFELDT